MRVPQNLATERFETNKQLVNEPCNVNWTCIVGALHMWDSMVYDYLHIIILTYKISESNVAWWTTMQSKCNEIQIQFLSHWPFLCELIRTLELEHHILSRKISGEINICWNFYLFQFLPCLIERKKIVSSSTGFICHFEQSLLFFKWRDNTSCKMFRRSRESEEGKAIMKRHTLTPKTNPHTAGHVCNKT